MGTRQEIGMFILLLVLSLPEAIGELASSKAPALQAQVRSNLPEFCPVQGVFMSGAQCVLLDLPMLLNQSTARHLEIIPGIGPVLAERIVKERKRRGRFECLEDLLEVKGIGPKRLATLRRYLQTVSHR